MFGWIEDWKRLAKIGPESRPLGYPEFEKQGDHKIRMLLQIPEESRLSEIDYASIFKLLVSEGSLNSLWAVEDYVHDQPDSRSLAARLYPFHFLVLVVDRPLTWTCRELLDEATKLGKPTMVLLNDEFQQENDLDIGTILSTSGFDVGRFVNQDFSANAQALLLRSLVVYYKYLLTREMFAEVITTLSRLRGFIATDTLSAERDMELIEQRLIVEGHCHLERKDSLLDSIEGEWEDAYFKKGDYAKALIWAKELYEKEPSPFRQLQLAWSYDRAGKPIRAIFAAHQAWKSCPTEWDFSSLATALGKYHLSLVTLKGDCARCVRKLLHKADAWP